MQEHSLTPKLSLVGSHKDKQQHHHHQKESPEYRQRASDREKRLIKEALAKGGPLTRRMLNHVTGIEIASLCRCLYNLCHKDHTVTVTHSARCPETGKIVFHYGLPQPETEGGAPCQAA